MANIKLFRVCSHFKECQGVLGAKCENCSLYGPTQPWGPPGGNQDPTQHPGLRLHLGQSEPPSPTHPGLAFPGPTEKALRNSSNKTPERLLHSEKIFLKMTLSFRTFYLGHGHVSVPGQNRHGGHFFVEGSSEEGTQEEWLSFASLKALSWEIQARCTALNHAERSVLPSE